MGVVVAHGANDTITWPSSVIVYGPVLSNLQVYEVRVIGNCFVEEHPFINNSPLFVEQQLTVNVASNPDIWTHTVTVGQPTLQIKANGVVLAIQSGTPGGAAPAAGVQVPQSVPFESQSEKYPLLPENLAL